MAKVSMVFEDTPDGGVTIKAIFEPEIKAGGPITGAQNIVLGMCAEAGQLIQNIFNEKAN